MTDVNLSYSSLESARFLWSHLDRTNLSHSVLYRSKWQGSSLAFVDFTNSDLTQADFTNTNLSGSNLNDSQIRSTASMEQAILPNRTFSWINHRNLVINGDGKFDSNYWEIIRSSVRVQDQSFIGLNGAAMLQRIFFDNYTMLVNENRAQYRLSAQMNGYATIHCYFLDGSALLLRTRLSR